MAVQLSIPYETLIALIDQLPDDQQRDLLRRLLDKASARPLSVDERLALLDSLTIDAGAVLPGYSDRREDW